MRRNKLFMKIKSASTSEHEVSNCDQPLSFSVCSASTVDYLLQMTPIKPTDKS